MMRIKRDKALSVIKAWWREKRREPTTTDIALRLGVAVSTAHTLIRELRASGALMEDSITPSDVVMLFPEDNYGETK